MLSYFMKTCVALLVIMNPITIVPMFLGLTQQETAESQRKIALKSTLIASIILVSFAALGDWFLGKLEIKDSALLIAGGILLLIFAIQRVLGSAEESLSAATAQHKHDIAVFPLAIPMIAGPGSLTMVAFYMKQASGSSWMQGVFLFCLLSVLAVNGVILVHANKVGKILGFTGTNVIIRVFGVILAAMAVQLILNGLLKYLSVFYGG